MSRKLFVVARNFGSVRFSKLTLSAFNLSELCSRWSKKAIRKRSSFFKLQTGEIHKTKLNKEITAMWISRTYSLCQRCQCVCMETSHPSVWLELCTYIWPCDWIADTLGSVRSSRCHDARIKCRFAIGIDGMDRPQGFRCNCFKGKYNLGECSAISAAHTKKIL